MKKTFLLFIALVLFYGCSPEVKEEEVVQDTAKAQIDTISAINEFEEQQATHMQQGNIPDTLVLDHYNCEAIDSAAYYSNTFVNNNFDKDSSIVQVSKNKLILPLNQNQKKVFVDGENPDDETDEFHYHYRGYSKMLQHYLVGKSMYENWQDLLINKVTGTETEISSTPSLNKDGTLLFAEQSRLCMVYECNNYGFELWEYSNQALRRIENVILHQHVVLDGKWNSKNELFVRTILIDAYMNQNGEPSYGFLYYKITRK